MMVDSTLLQATAGDCRRLLTVGFYNGLWVAVMFMGAAMGYGRCNGLQVAERTTGFATGYGRCNG